MSCDFLKNWRQLVIFFWCICYFAFKRRVIANKDGKIDSVGSIASKIERKKKKEELRTISKRVLRKTNQGKAQDLFISANAASMWSPDFTKESFSMLLHQFKHLAIRLIKWPITWWLCFQLNGTFLPESFHKIFPKTIFKAYLQIMATR